MYKNYIKRPLDFFIALLLLTITLPLNIFVIALLTFNNGGKVFFVQSRPGKNGKIFKIIKYKTMNDRRNDSGELLPDIERLTSVGRLIRKTSLDELPQLINVLMGDLSIVGPRPLLVDYLPLYNEFQLRRHEVTPGITGWAQVNGRNSITWEDKFKFDVWYVDNVSIFLDLKILFMTCSKVFMSNGINASKNSTMNTFRGTSNL
jgi:lipopolysaccharide/colanic/teichoic acid biosynthesis glycosyltransferase